MATIINTPGSGESDSGAGLVVGIIIAIVLIGLFVIYGVPALRRNQAPSGGTNINVSLPAGGGSTNGAPAGGTTTP